MKMKMNMKKVGDDDDYLVMKVIIVKEEVMTCDFSPVVMFLCKLRRGLLIFHI